MSPANNEGAIRELEESIQLRHKAQSNCESQQSVSHTHWSCHFLALAHNQLGNEKQARAWLAKAVVPRNAP
jgi:hypothetical protein